MAVEVRAGRLILMEPQVMVGQHLAIEELLVVALGAALVLLMLRVEAALAAAPRVHCWRRL